MTPAALGRVIVSTHRLALTVRTNLALPQNRRFLDADQHLAFLLDVINALDSPAIAQYQNLLKYFLGDHSDSQFTQPSTHNKRRGLRR